MEELTLLELIEWQQHPYGECAGQPFIPNSKFAELAIEVQGYEGVNLDAHELFDAFVAESLRFSACGANNGDRHGVLRKNPETGWQYIIDIMGGKKEKPE